MTGPVRLADVQPGAELPEQRYRITRADLVRYAGASGDFNPIHWNERVATSVGLPNVIAHGMFTMATAVRVVTDWTGDPGSVVEYGVRFTRPVAVPDPEGAVLHVEACQAAVRRGLSEARSVLRDVADADTVERAIETWQRESARLIAERRAVGLVEEALRGRRFVARL